MADSALSTDEGETSVWQNLALEQDLLLHVFEKLSSSQLVRLSTVSRGWRHTMTVLYDPWPKIEVRHAQARSASFAVWVRARERCVRHLSIADEEVEIPPQSEDRQFLASMRHLQTFQDGVGVNMDSLQYLQPSLEAVQAVCQVDLSNLDDQGCGTLDLTHLLGLTQLELHMKGQYKPVCMRVQLAKEAPLEVLKLISVSNVTPSSLCPGLFQHLRSLYLSAITSQEQLEDVLSMTTLEELTVGIDTCDGQVVEVPDGHDHVNFSNVGNLVNLRQLDLMLIDCYLVNGHLVQRLSQLQQLSLSMTDSVAVLFRPEDGSHYGLPCMLNSLQHVQLSMHSVFDVTDCLEGLQLISSLRSLHVSLQASPARGPSEVHWAIKEGSVLARAVSLQHLQVECTSMLIKVLPPKLRSLYVTARKINVQADLKIALSMLDACHLQARHGVEYFQLL